MAITEIVSAEKLKPGTIVGYVVVNQTDEGTTTIVGLGELANSDWRYIDLYNTVRVVRYQALESGEIEVLIERLCSESITGMEPERTQVYTCSSGAREVRIYSVE